MASYTMDNTEAVKIVNAMKPFVKEWTSEWEHSCVRAKQMTVVTAPSTSTGKIGVREGFGDEEIFIPYSTMLTNAAVGDVVYCCWVADNQATMVAMWDGTMTQTQIPVETGIKFVELWTNSSQSSSFAGQTVTIDECANYSAFVMIFKHIDSSTWGHVSCIVLEKSNTYNAISQKFDTSENEHLYASRGFKVLNTGAYFEGAVLVSSNGETSEAKTNNNYLIPITLYGIQGASIIPLS